jgi:hypothetical protein
MHIPYVCLGQCAAGRFRPCDLHYFGSGLRGRRHRTVGCSSRLGFPNYHLVSFRILRGVSRNPLSNAN